MQSARKRQASQRLSFGGGGVEGGNVAGCQHGSLIVQLALAHDVCVNGLHESGSIRLQNACSKSADWSVQSCGGSMHAANAVVGGGLFAMSAAYSASGAPEGRSGAGDGALGGAH